MLRWSAVHSDSRDGCRAVVPGRSSAQIGPTDTRARGVFDDQAAIVTDHLANRRHVVSVDPRNNWHYWVGIQPVPSGVDVVPLGHAPAAAAGAATGVGAAAVAPSTTSDSVATPAASPASKRRISSRTSHRLFLPGGFIIKPNKSGCGSWCGLRELPARTRIDALCPVSCSAGVDLEMPCTALAAVIPTQWRRAAGGRRRHLAVHGSASGRERVIHQVGRPRARDGRSRLIGWQPAQGRLPGGP